MRDDRAQRGANHLGLGIQEYEIELARRCVLEDEVRVSPGIELTTRNDIPAREAGIVDESAAYERVAREVEIVDLRSVLDNGNMFAVKTLIWHDALLSLQPFFNSPRAAKGCTCFYAKSMGRSQVN